LLKTYYRLTKPGIIYGNALTAASGFLLASRWHIKVGLFLATLAGISLVIASACVINNFIDRHIDQQMARTRQRALVSGQISGQNALIYASVLGVAGFSLLALYTNLLTVAIGLIGFLDYVVLYSIAKRRSVQGTVIGSISGATPIVAGYTAVTGRFDSGALVLFMIMVLWQMPHFYAIAMYRFKDYSNAHLPVLPVKKGMYQTKRQILSYIAAFTISTSLLTAFGYTGYTYLVVMLSVGLVWFLKGLQGFKTSQSEQWARQMFFLSLIVVMVLSATVATGAVLP